MSKFTKVIFSSTMLIASALALNAAGLHAEPADTPPPPHEHGRPCEGGWHHEPGGFHGLRELNLSQDQKDKIKLILENQKTAAQAQFESIHQSFKALDDAARAYTYDAKQVQALADKQSKLQTALIIQRTETKHQIYALLTPEQKQKWSELPPPHHDGEKRGWGKAPQPE
jgi:Spy/CpxP family protein refolding chaperone